VNQPRNVTPGYEDPGNPYRAAGADAPPPEESRPEWLAWSWAAGRDRSFPWLGALLVLVGAGLLLEYFVPSLTAGTLILGAVGLLFLAGFVFGHSYFAFVVGAIISALVIARLFDELNIYDGPGITSLAVAGAFLAIWLVGPTRRRRAMWPLWGAAIFGLIGFVQVSGRLSAMPELGALWPVALIVVGLIIVLGGRRRPA
jgi:hypothetical protein